MKGKSNDPYYEAKRKWRLEHPDYNQEYQRNHSEQHKKASRKWVRTHAEEHKKICQNWNEKHPDRDSNIQRRPEQHRAQVYAQMYCPLAPLCELCPEDNVQPATQRHHFAGYAYPKIFVSCCASCHMYVEKGVD